MNALKLKRATLFLPVILSLFLAGAGCSTTSPLAGAAQTEDLRVTSVRLDPEFARWVNPVEGYGPGPEIHVGTIVRQVFVGGMNASRWLELEKCDVYRRPGDQTLIGSLGELRCSLTVVLHNRDGGTTKFRVTGSAPDTGDAQAPSGDMTGGLSGQGAMMTGPGRNVSNFGRAQRDAAYEAVHRAALTLATKVQETNPKSGNAEKLKS